MISYHRNPNQDARNFGSGFDVANTQDLERISRGMMKFVWSPIIWKGGVRRQTEFYSCHYAVLDFDDGETSLKEALKLFCDVNHVIGTTKSHRIAKGSAQPVDRFRVLLEWKNPVSDLRTYRYNMSTLVGEYDADKACVDGARYFYPCQEIISVVTDADYFPCRLNVPEDFESPLAQAAKEKHAKLMWQRYQKLPEWTDHFLIRGKCFNGKGREVSAFMCASQMRLAGLAKDEAYSLLLKAPIDLTNFHAERELRHAVNSAYK